MLLFCPTCSNLLIVELSEKCYRFSCNTCPFISNITSKVCYIQYIIECIVNIFIIQN